MTIRIAVRSELAEMRKTTVFLAGAAHLLCEVYHQVHDLSPDMGAEEAALEVKAALDVWKDDQIFEQLIALKLQEFPTISSFNAYSLGRSTAQLIKLHMETFEYSTLQTIIESAKGLNARISDLENEMHGGQPGLEVLKALGDVILSVPRAILVPWR